jgi:DNA-binding transcriptional ArsR family regulator
MVALTDSPGDGPGRAAAIRVEFAGPARQDRLTVLIRLILAVPHFICLGIAGLATQITIVGGWLVALVMGRRLAGLELEPLAALLRLPGYQPDFLNPPPQGPCTEFGTELEQLTRTPSSRVMAELGQALHATPAGQAALRAHPELGGEPEKVRDALAGMLRRAWQALVQPWWSRLREVLDADITFRARQLADAAVAVTLNDLDPKIRWREGRLRVAVRASERCELTGRGLVLMPSVFGWPQVAVMYDPPAAVYPARGIARLWQPPPTAGGALPQLIGRTRAAILTALADPATTSGVAARCGLSIATASEHLGVLRAAKLVTSTRTGRSVTHERSALGVALSGREDPDR